MNAQEFKVGDVIRNDDYDRLPVGATVCLGLGFATFTKEADNLWRSDHGDEARDEIKRFNRNLISLPAEPEDKDDLYVEPEPLKEGDWVQVWARFGVVDEHVPSHVELPMPDGRVHDGYVRPDAIVRPDEGDLPPWVKPARCTSLYRLNGHSEPGVILGQCSKDEHDSGEGHRNVGSDWTDAEEYGRVEVSS